MIRFAFISMMMAGSATAAEALVPLSQVKDVNDGLVAVAVADHIRNKCSTIEPRLIVAWRYLGSLETRAQQLGYSDEEIEDFVTDKSEKKRIAALAGAYIVEHDAKPNDKDSLCRLGREEIAANSAVGNLLREK
ncbi:MAG: DUF5333 domain-containing protein [Pseudomonadota bacterium]|nr:DUF5333 domain-containing protein [Pseudomonadota bacterium]MEE3070327.1 DUF5333 domain-containing protein [Pseudomonadota bacterium]